MERTLSLLVELQQIDDALRELREAKEQLERVKQENAESLTVFDGLLAERNDRIEETRSYCVEKEAEIKETEANIARSRSRLTSITSQKELNALNKELDAQRKMNHQANDELLKLLEQLESAQADHADKTQARKALKSEMRLVEKSLIATIAEKEASATQLNDRRKGIRGGLDRPTISRYDRVSKARGGLAVSQISTPTCTACNMSVSPQVFIRLQRGETLENCTHCMRMLVYVAPEEEQT